MRILMKEERGPWIGVERPGLPGEAAPRIAMHRSAEHRERGCPCFIGDVAARLCEKEKVRHGHCARSSASRAGYLPGHNRRTEMPRRFEIWEATRADFPRPDTII